MEPKQAMASQLKHLPGAGPIYAAARDWDAEQFEWRTLPDQATALRWFATENAKKRNVYLHFCEMKDSFTGGRANAKDALASRACWVDVDVPPKVNGEQLKLAKMAIIDRARGMKVPPTYIMDSGHGLWLIWVIERTEDLDAVYEVNHGFAQQVGSEPGVYEADSCYDVSRLGRVAGSVNWNTPKKRADGREDEGIQGGIIEGSGQSYKIEDLAEHRVARKPSSGSAGPVTAAAEPVRSLKVLDRYFPKGHRMSVIVEHGEDPDEPKEGDDTRSGWECDFYRNCVRWGVPDETILGIATNRAWKIGEKGDWDLDYARRQLGKAHGAVGVVLDKSTPRLSARIFRQRVLPHLLNQKWLWLEYVGAGYKRLPEGALKKRLSEFLETATQVGRGKTPPSPFPLNRTTKNEVLDQLTDLCFLEDYDGRPQWINGAEGPPASEMVVFANTMLHVPTGRTMDLTPDFFTLNGLPYDYDPDATCPLWEEALRRTFRSNPEMIELLRKAIGYALLCDGSFHKFFLLVGVPGGGKSLIMKVLKAVVGAEHYVGTMVDDLTSAHGLAALVGKTVGAVTDAHFDPRDTRQTIRLLNRLKAISGGDDTTVNEKHQAIVSMRLTLTWWLVMNQMFDIPDPSGALADRAVPIVFSDVIRGTDDEIPNLDRRIIEEEIAGVVNWALTGLRDLLEFGDFTLPEESQVLVDELRHGDSVSRFWDQYCRPAAGEEHTKDAVYEYYQMVCSNRGWAPVEENEFKTALVAAARGRVKQARLRRTIDGNVSDRAQLFVGLGWRGHGPKRDPEVAA